MFSKIEYRKFCSQRRFGVELETSGSLTKNKIKSVIDQNSKHSSIITRYQLSGDSSSWHIKEDSTCGPRGRLGKKGIEIASFVGKGIKDISHIANVASSLKEAGCDVNSNCGLHIHVESKDLTPYHVGKILAYWLKIEQTISLSLPPCRNDNIYCQSYWGKNFSKLDLNRKYSPNQLYDILCPRDISLYENQDRRMNLNIVNYERARILSTFHRKTIELRWPEGTLSSKDIRCWLRLFLHFIDNCKNLPMPENILPSSSLKETLCYLGLHHNDDTFFILSEGLHETKTWFLERILNQNIFNKIIGEKEILNSMWYPIKKY